MPASEIEGQNELIPCFMRWSHLTDIVTLAVDKEVSINTFFSSLRIDLQQQKHSAGMRAGQQKFPAFAKAAGSEI